MRDYSHGMMLRKVAILPRVYAWNTKKETDVTLMTHAETAWTARWCFLHYPTVHVMKLYYAYLSE